MKTDDAHARCRLPALARLAAAAGAGALLILAGTAAAGAGTPQPTVAIVSPSAGVATNAESLAVDVRFAASANDRAAGATGNVHTLVLTLDGDEVGRYANPPSVREGSYRFSLGLTGVAEGTHTLRAFAYQGNARAGLRGESQPLQLVVDRTAPELELTAPPDGLFAREPRVTVRGTAADGLSGLAALSCAGDPIPVAAAFSCEPALDEGRNELVVRAVDGAGNASERSVVVDHFPGGLAGLPGTRALAAAEDVFAPGAYAAPGEITDGVIRTQLELVFAREATVGEANGLLRRLDARIVSQLEGVLIATVRVPDPGTVDALDAVLARLAGEPVLRAAGRVVVAQPDVLPAVVSPSEGAHLIDHQLAVRAHAAWNARAAIEAGSAPTLLVADYFGAGPPHDFEVINPADFATGSHHPHGYHVLGIAAATFDEGSSGSFSADAVTGVFPGTPPLRAVDGQAVASASVMNDLIVDAIRDAPGKVVLNTSMGFNCETPADAAANCSTENAAEKALRWIERVRGSDPANPGTNVEGKFVHASSAGNIAPGVAPVGALLNSEHNAAALAPLVDPSTGQAVANLANTLVVENFANTAIQPFRPGCIAPSSESGGTIGAIGEGVHSFTSPTATGTKSGTSMASPQAAGLAASVWALRPGLASAQVVSLLERTARPVPGCGSGRIIDAYAAVLAADEGIAARPVRRAILDVFSADQSLAPDGAFDQHDVEYFLDQLEARDGNIDYSRYDLNGSGRTGIRSSGEVADRFDLDLDADYGLVPLEVEGLTLRFDESALTDDKVLCHSAYSELYPSGEAATQARSELLGLERCLELELEGDFPASVAAGDDNVLTVRALDADLPEAVGGQAGVRLELTAAGGEITDSVGTTDSDGVFETEARLSVGEPELVIEIVARAGEDGPELARTTVRASGQPIEVRIDPASATLAPGGTRQFAADVDNASDPRVTWSATGGTITPTGLYTAGTTPGVYSVTATSVQDPTKSATATVTIAGGDVRGIYEVTAIRGCTPDFCRDLFSEGHHISVVTSRHAGFTHELHMNGLLFCGRFQLVLATVNVFGSTASASEMVSAPCGVLSNWPGPFDPYPTTLTFEVGRALTLGELIPGQFSSRITARWLGCGFCS